MIKGIQEINAKLKDLEDNKLEKKIIRKGLRSGAKIALQAAIAESPVKTGVVRNSLKVRAGKTRKGLISIIVGFGTKWFTGPTFYASFVLFGHKIGSRRLGDKRTLQPANNFLKRAYESSKDQAANTAMEKMKQLLEEELAE